MKRFLTLLPVAPLLLLKTRAVANTKESYSWDAFTSDPQTLRALRVGCISGHLETLFSVAKAKSNIPHELKDQLDLKTACFPVWSSRVLATWLQIAGYRGKLTTNHPECSLEDLEAVNLAFSKLNHNDIGLAFSERWSHISQFKCEPGFVTNCFHCEAEITGKQLQTTRCRYQPTFLPGSHYYGNFVMLVCNKCAEKDASWSQEKIPDFYFS